MVLSRILSLGEKLYKVLSRGGGSGGMPSRKFGNFKSSEINFDTIREVNSRHFLQIFQESLKFLGEASPPKSLLDRLNPACIRIKQKTYLPRIRSSKINFDAI